MLSEMSDIAYCMILLIYGIYNQPNSETDSRLVAARGGRNQFSRSVMSDSLLPHGLHQAKREKTQINKIRNEKGEVTIDYTGIQRIIREYYEQLYANKMDNLEEMDKFLEKYNLLKQNQEEIENMNRPITSTEIETVITNLSINKSPGPDGFTSKFYHKFQEKLTHSLLKLFQKIEEEGKLSILFCCCC